MDQIEFTVVDCRSDRYHYECSELGDHSGQYYQKAEVDDLLSKWQSALDEAREETAKDRAAIAAHVAEIARLEMEKEFQHGRAEAYHNEAIKYRRI